ncbi:hypothetical protein D3C74_361190 [compost metagenome]
MEGWIFLMPSSVSSSSRTLSIACRPFSGSAIPDRTAQVWAFSQIFASSCSSLPRKRPSSIMARRNQRPSQPMRLTSSRCCSYMVLYFATSSGRPAATARSTIRNNTRPSCMAVQMLSPRPSRHTRNNWSFQSDRSINGNPLGPSFDAVKSIAAFKCSYTVP